MTHKQTSAAVLFCMILGLSGTVLWAADLMLAAHIFWGATLAHACFSTTITIWPVVAEVWQEWREKHQQ